MLGTILPFFTQANFQDKSIPYPAGDGYGFRWSCIEGGLLGLIVM